MLDPFKAEDPEDVQRLKSIQAEIHRNFKALVRERRQSKLTAAEDKLFNGDVWTGRRAQELGLIDDLGDLRTVMRQRYGDKVRFHPVGDRAGWLRRRFAVSPPPSSAGYWGRFVAGLDRGASHVGADLACRLAPIDPILGANDNMAPRRGGR